MAQSLEYDRCGLHPGSNLDLHCSVFILQVLLSQKQQSVDGDKTAAFFLSLGLSKLRERGYFGSK